MVKESLEVFSSDEEKEKSPFSFLLMLDPTESATDVRAIYSYRKNNIASRDLSLTGGRTEEDNKKIISAVDDLTQDFLQKFRPSDNALNNDKIKFAEKVRGRVICYLNGDDTSDPLEV